MICVIDIIYYLNDVYCCKIYLFILMFVVKFKMGFVKVDIIDFEINGKWKILGIKLEVELLEVKNIECVVIFIILER